MANIVKYSRVSSDDQIKNFSVPQQNDDLDKWAEQRGHTIVASFSDEGFSAWNFDRPDWKALVNYCKENKDKVDYVLVALWDRFGRNVIECLTWIDVMNQKYGIEVNSISQWIDFRVPESDLMLSIYLTNGQVYLKRLKINTQTGIKSAWEKGYYPNGAPFGYDNVRINGRGSIAPNSDAQIVKWIFETYTTMPVGIRELITMTRRRWGKSPTRTGMHLLLKRVAYTGYVNVPADGENPAYITQGVHEGIIDLQTFEKAQEILEGKAPARSFRKDIDENLPLRPHLICPRCGRSLTGSASKGRSRYYYYYHCNAPCKARYKSEDAHDQFYGLLSAIKPSPAVLALFEELLTRELQQVQKDGKKRLKEIYKQTIELNQQIDEAEDMVFDGRIKQEVFERGKSKRLREIELLEHEAKQIESVGKENISWVKETCLLLKNIDSFYRDADFDTKTKLTGSIFPEKLTFDENGYRTTTVNPLITALMAGNPDFINQKAQKKDTNFLVSCSVAGAGLEPATFGL